MMSASATWPMSSRGGSNGEIERYIGAALEAIWAPVLQEPVPEYLLSAVPVEFGGSFRKDSKAANWQRMGFRFARTVLDMVAPGAMESLEHRRVEHQRRIVERAIRKQGVAWMVTDDPGSGMATRFNGNARDRHRS